MLAEQQRGRGRAHARRRRAGAARPPCRSGAAAAAPGRVGEPVAVVPARAPRSGRRSRPAPRATAVHRDVGRAARRRSRRSSRPPARPQTAGARRSAPPARWRARRRRCARRRSGATGRPGAPCRAPPRARPARCAGPAARPTRAGGPVVGEVEAETDEPATPEGGRRARAGVQRTTWRPATAAPRERRRRRPRPRPRRRRRSASASSGGAGVGRRRRWSRPASVVPASAWSSPSAAVAAGPARLSASCAESATPAAVGLSAGQVGRRLGGAAPVTGARRPRRTGAACALGLADDLLADGQRPRRAR